MREKEGEGEKGGRRRGGRWARDKVSRERGVEWWAGGARGYAPGAERLRVKEGRWLRPRSGTEESEGGEVVETAERNRRE